MEAGVAEVSLDPLAAPEEEEDAVALQQVPTEPAREADLTAKKRSLSSTRLHLHSDTLAPVAQSISFVISV